MTGFRVDAELLVAYARTVDGAADELEAVHGALAADVLSADDFGALGREVGAGAAYQRAAEALRAQLAAGGVALRSAGEALDQVAGQHGGGEDEAAARIRKAVES